MDLAATVDVCGPVEVPRTELGATGARVGPYVLGPVLGRGGMGVVHTAIDPRLQRRVALKLLPGGAIEDADTRRRLIREARALARVPHPNVVTVYDAGEVLGPRGDVQVFIAMELVEGVTLRRWLARPGRSHAEIVAVLRSAGAGLAAVHAAGLVHRDFKPDNVMVGDDGRVRVMDFGIARPLVRTGDPGGTRPPELAAFFAAEPPSTTAPTTSPTTRRGTTARDADRRDPPATADGRLVGTPAYMAPEVFRGEPADARSDQFSFGVVLFEAMYGARPWGARGFAEMVLAVTQGAIVEPKDRRVPAALRRVCRRALAVDPVARWPSMAAIVDALGRPTRRWTGLLALGAAALVAVSVVPGPEPRCRASAESIERSWSVERRAAVPEAFERVSPSFGRDAGTRFVAAVDRHVHALDQARHAACAVADASQARAGFACVDRHVASLEVLLAAVASPDAKTVEHAVTAAADLGDPSACLGDARSSESGVDPVVDARAAERVAASETHARLGDLGRAWTAANEAVGLAEGVASAETIASALRQRADVSHRLGGFGDVVRDAEAAYFTATAGGVDGEAARALALLLLAHCERGVVASAEPWGEIAIAWSRRFTHDDGITADLQYAIGHYHKLRGDTPASLAAYREALAADERDHPIEHRDLGASHNALATALTEAGDYEAALDELDAARDIWTRTLGPRHPDVAVALLNRAGPLLELGQPERAYDDTTAALALLRESYGPDSEVVAVAELNLVDVLARQGAIEQASIAAEHSVEQWLAPSRPWDVRAAIALQNAAAMRAALEDYAGAARRLERALAWLLVELDADDPRVAQMRTLLGLAYDLADDPRAEAELEQAVRALRDANDPALTRALLTLADLELELGDHAAAREHYRAAQRRLAEVPPVGEEREQLLAGLAALGEPTTRDSAAHADASPAAAQ